MSAEHQALFAGSHLSNNDRINSTITRIRALENELELAFEQARTDLRLRFERDKVVFEERILKRHRELKIRLRDYVRGARPTVILTAPFIYGLIVPIVLLDVCVTIYQAVCFRVYGIPRVERGAYIIFDRQALVYLNALEKLNCAYCSYANGLFAYVREIAARTEQYWCPIKHARRMIAPHARYADFVDYGDAESYHLRLEKLRQELTAPDSLTRLPGGEPAASASPQP